MMLVETVIKKFGALLRLVVWPVPCTRTCY